MNHYIRQGIVIRFYGPYKQKVALLDEELGHIEATILSKKNARLPHGALVNYVLESTVNSYQLVYSDIIALPQAWAREDIIFLHHALELCSYFIPFNSRTPTVFAWLSQWYTLNEYWCSTVGFKNFFIAKFFFLIGWYPEPRQKKDRELMSLISGPIDIMFEGELDQSITIHLNEWLEECITLHPLAHCLKTVPLFMRMDKSDYER
jgi:hypothetical protein